MRAIWLCLALYALLLAAFACTPAHAGEQDGPDINQCHALAVRYVADPFSLAMGELDDLRNCMAWQMHAMQEEQRDRAIDRAITHNFSKEDDK